MVSGSGFGEKGCEGSGDVGGLGAAVTPPRPSVPALLGVQSRPPNQKALKIVCWGGMNLGELSLDC